MSKAFTVHDVFYDAVLGVVTFNSLNRVVSSLDADFGPSVLLEIISESSVPICEVHSTRTRGHVIKYHVPRVPATLY